MQGKSLFTYVHRQCIFWIVHYDDVRVRYRLLNCLQNRTILPVVTSLWLRVTLASANEWKLLKINSTVVAIYYDVR